MELGRAESRLDCRTKQDSNDLARSHRRVNSPLDSDRKKSVNSTVAAVEIPQKARMLFNARTVLHNLSTGILRVVHRSRSTDSGPDIASIRSVPQSLAKLIGGTMAGLSPAARRTRNSPLMQVVLRHADCAEVQLAPSPAEIRADIEAIFEGFHLQRIRRFYRQHHWSDETTAAEFSDRAEPGLKLENVAAHSWHVADSAHLLAGHFPELDQNRVVVLALLHDKLEIYTGDFDPVGADGKGTDTHAFNEAAKSRVQTH